MSNSESPDDVPQAEARFCGGLTIREAAEAKTRLLPSGAAPPSQLDLSGVTAIDSAGLQILVALRREAARAGGELRYANAAPCVVQTAARAGLGEHLGLPAGEGIA